MTAPPATADLLRHARWVHALARVLARDEHRAADLAQQTWVAVLERPPAHDANVRGFFATVLRNLWRQDLRAEARRRRRELAAGEAQLPVAPTDDVVARAIAQRTVVEEVLALDEPYRSTVLRRFFDGWSVRRIADHDGVPVATVRTRLQRALHRLRRQLGQRSGRGLCATLLPILSRPWFLLPVLAMKTKLAACAVAAVLAVLLAIQYLPRAAAEATPEGGESSRPMAVAAAPRTATPTAAEPGQRRVAETGPKQPAEAPRAAVASVTGRLRTADDQPLPERRVAFVTRADRTSQATGTDGAFRFAVEQDGRIEIDEAGWTTVMTALVPAESPPRHALVVAAPAVGLAGVVVDEQGAPVPQATVEVVLPDTFRTRFGDDADAAAVMDWRATSGADGRFAIAAAPGIDGASLLAAQPSFLPERRAMPPAGDPALRVVLRKPAVADGALLGQVIDGGGRIATGVWISSGGQVTRTDEQGNFALPGGGGEDLLAAGPGLVPARILRPGEGWPASVLVRLGSAALRITGRVLDGAGQPCSGVRVWVTNATPFGRGRETVVVEGISSGAPMREQRGWLGEERPMAIWPWTRTGRDGSFALEGLFDRAYDLRAMRDDNLLWIDQPRVAAGTSGVELRLPADGTFAEIAGRVVSSSGAPVPNVRIASMCDAQRVGGSTMHAQGSEARTGADGRFRLRDVPRRTAYLRLDGEGIVPLEHGRGVDGGLLELTAGNALDLTITVHLRVHVQVELGDAAAADGLEVLDGAGRKLMIDVFEGRSRTTLGRLPFAAGRTPVFVVPDSAATLVLRMGEREVRREAVVLVTGDVNRLRF
jgi:RNA polymerase sigma factor (sigma-70 family)